MALARNLWLACWSLFLAWVCDFYAVVFGIDLGPLSGQLRAQARGPAIEERGVPMPPRRFEAYTDCPRCGHLDVHRLREPRNWLAPVPAMRLVGPDRWEPLSDEERRQLDESMFDVIRICTDCGHEWGML